MSNATPAIPFFGDAYLADTRHLSLEEHGAYLQLIMIAWRIEGCCLPDDDVRLARMLGVTAAKWQKLKPVVMAFWTLENGVWTQARLSRERAFVEKKRATNKAAAEARWESQGTENKQSGQCERNSERNAPPPLPLKKEVEEKVEAAPQLRARAQPVSEAVLAWNEAARAVGWPLALKADGNRGRNISGRLKENGLDGWRAAIIRARQSPYLSQAPPPTWFTLDWLAGATNFLKVIEGNYDRNRSDNAKPSGWAAARDFNLARHPG